jgi:hypothetical protein
MTARLAFPMVILLMVVGCAGSPVPVDLPQNNPSDPEAPDSPFLLPPDPFGNQISDDRSSGHGLTENPEGSHLTRGDLFNSPTGRSAPSVHKNDAGDHPPSEMPHRHHMESGQ